LIKVLILCNDFPPLNSIGAYRPYSWFKFFKKYNVEVVVITKNWQKGYSSDQEIAQNVTEQSTFSELPEGIIIRVSQSQLFTEKLFAKWGSKRFVLFRKGLTFLFKIFSFLHPKFDKHFPIYLTAKKFLSENEVDYIIATSEPFILFKYAHNLSKEFNVKWVADYRDGWFHDHTTNFKKDIFTKLLQYYELFFEKLYVKSSHLIITVDSFLEKKLKDMHNKTTKVITNGFDRFYDFPIKEKTAKKLILTHLGTLANNQKVEIFLEALKLIVKENNSIDVLLEVNFIGLEYNQAQYNRVMKYDSTLQEIINTTPRISQEKAVNLASNANYFLSFTDPKYSAIYAKNYEYIAIKRPILVIPDDNGLLSKFVKQLNAGFILNNVNDIINFINDELENMSNNGFTRSKYELNEIAAQKYLRENQAKELADTLNYFTKK